MSRSLSITVSAPAKINIYLDVKGKRSDGYHELETLMLPISLADTIEIVVTIPGSGVIKLERTGFRVDVPPEKDLTTRAARLFLDLVGVSADISMKLDKRVPPGSGMGGGSSDAAAVLSGLCQLLAPDRASELHGLAAQIGSDVPFFLSGRPAFCRGRGEIIEPLDLPGVPCEGFVIAVPPTVVNTGAVYGAFSRAHRDPNPYTDAFDFLKRWLAWKGAPFHNGLWRAALEVCPILADYMSLLPGFLWTMTGSGSAFFIPLDRLDDADKLLYRIPAAAGFRVFVVRPRLAPVVATSKEG